MTQVHAVIHEVDLTMRLLKDLVSEYHRLEQEGNESLTPLGPLVRALESRPSLDGVPQMLFDAHREIVQALSGLRHSREAIQGHAITALRDTGDKLNEVSSATETAAVALLDILDRTLVVINAIDPVEDAPDAGNGEDEQPLHRAVVTLKSEIDSLFHFLQFQDITAQQISGAAAGLVAVEDRLGALAPLFDPERVPAGVHLDQALQSEGGYYPDAKFENASERQEFADRILEAHGKGFQKGTSPRADT